MSDLAAQHLARHTQWATPFETVQPRTVWPWRQIDVMRWREITMDTWGWIILIAGALVIGLVAQYLIRRGVGYEWILVSIGAGVGGYVASEYELAGLGKWGTEVAGLAIFPALIGALIVGTVVSFLVYFGERTTAKT